MKLSAGLFMLVCLVATQPLLAADRKAPNIMIIMADDMGYSDASCYGGEISTPNLDALANNGLRFTQFYNTARCWPSRAALMTGYYAQQVRRDTVPGLKSGNQGVRPAWAKLLPEMLRPLGYRAYQSGKWHIDGKPLLNGFDHSYVIEDHDRHFYPKRHTEDDRELPAVSPNSGYYTSTAIASHAIKCLNEHAEESPDQPFLSYIAFTAPHFPVQAPPEDIARYLGKYEKGWDRLREERWQRMRSLRVGGSQLSNIERRLGPPYAFPAAIKNLGPDEINLPVTWNSLSESQRDFQTSKMAVHAAMVDRMDQEIGRVISELKRTGKFENTLIFFLSDNGASAEMMVRGDGHDPKAPAGSGPTFLSIGPGWSSLANTPFRRHKTWVHEGGISTPLIVHWPQGIQAKGELRETPGHLVDLVPTILEVARGPQSSNREAAGVVKGPGKSLVPVFQSATHEIQRESIWWLHEGNRALRVGNWKIVSAGINGAWELYDLTNDRTESKNLAAENSEKLKELVTIWTRQFEAISAQAKAEK